MQLVLVNLGLLACFVTATSFFRGGHLWSREAIVRASLKNANIRQQALNRSQLNTTEEAEIMMQSILNDIVSNAFAEHVVMNIQIELRHTMLSAFACLLRSLMATVLSICVLISATCNVFVSMPVTTTVMALALFLLR